MSAKFPGGGSKPILSHPSITTVRAYPCSLSYECVWGGGGGGGGVEGRDAVI